MFAIFGDLEHQIENNSISSPDSCVVGGGAYLLWIHLFDIMKLACPLDPTKKRPSVDATEACGAKKLWATSTWIMLVYCLVNGKHSWLETPYFPIGNTFSKGPLFTFLYQTVILSML